ncbi:Alpha/Beta hydrolase protein [Nemania sp. NC0429]|nr:Alpha/Beta hydrolase protein [Nemania sp. NC0429]
MAPAVKLDPEWALIWQGNSTMPKPVVTDIFELRDISNFALQTSTATIEVPSEIAETKRTIASLDGTRIAVHRFVPPAAASDPSPQRAIVYAFPGGTIAGGIDVWRRGYQDLAHRIGTQVFAVDYRLAPEHHAPAAAEDVYAATRWLQERAGEFNIDPRRVVLYGPSAGGGIVAGAALLARDKGELRYPIAALWLRYPMLDDRTLLAADDPAKSYHVWTSEENDIAWKAYVGKGRDERTDKNVSIYGAPARAKDVSGLPDTFIDVGGMDLFINEDLEFARRLAVAGVFVEVHVYPGVPHGFDLVRHLKVSRQAQENEERFLKRY